MAATPRLNYELIEKYSKQMKTATDPLDLLRAHCLSRGASGIKGLGRAFRIMDDNDNKTLDFSEFKKGLHDYGVDLDPEIVNELYHRLDRDKSGLLDFDEFLRALRVCKTSVLEPPMPRCRKELIIKAFQKLDRVCDGVITVDDLKGVYSVKYHPKYISGEWNEAKCLQEFLVGFDTPNEADGVITEEEFMNYYAGVSASIDNDAYFDLMMRNAWKI